jgi:hypothetical protein
MSTVAALIVFSGIAATICARSRAAGPALLFGVVAVVLFGTTDVGRTMLDALVAFGGHVNDAAAAVGDHSG